MVFHVHIDASTIDPSIEQFATKDLGFWRSDFSGAPAGVRSFFPKHHFTKKITSSADFHASFDRLVTFAENRPGELLGYVEGEFIALDEELPERPFDPTWAAAPFRLETEELGPGAFRESELHLVMDRDRSDPRVVEALTATGMFPAYIAKAYGTAIIFTAQGSRAVVRELIRELSAFLARCGGIVKGSLKEERIAKYWLPAPDIPRPPVVCRIPMT
jgi:hypothetical protein